MTGMQAANHPDAPPSPGRGGYLLGAAIIAIGALLGGTLFAVGLVSALSLTPELTDRFDATTPRTVTLTAGADVTIYAEGNRRPNAASICRVVNAAGVSISLSEPGSQFRFRDGGRQWVNLLNFTAPTAGSYTVTCTPTGNGVGRYAVAPRPDTGSFVARLILSIVGLGVFLTTGLLVGIFTIVRARRRRRARLV